MLSGGTGSVQDWEITAVTAIKETGAVVIGEEIEWLCRRFIYDVTTIDGDDDRCQTIPRLNER